MEKIERKKSFLFFIFCVKVGEVVIVKIMVGLIAGLTCGLFGTGGGMILVPAFIYVLKMNPRNARATSICCMLVMVITSSIFYYKGNYINWQIAGLCAVGGVIGGYFGAKILKKIPDYILKIAFICFLIYVSYNMIF